MGTDVVTASPPLLQFPAGAAEFRAEDGAVHSWARHRALVVLVVLPAPVNTGRQTARRARQEPRAFGEVLSTRISLYVLLKSVEERRFFFGFCVERDEDAARAPAERYEAPGIARARRLPTRRNRSGSNAQHHERPRWRRTG